MGVDQGEIEFLSNDAVHQLQSCQLTIRAACHSIMKFIAPLILECLNRDFPWGAGANEKGSTPIQTPAAYVYICLQIVEGTVEIMEAERATRTLPDDTKVESQCVCVE